MNRRLLVEAGPIETRLALLEDGVPVEFLLWPATRRPLLGEIRLGRVIEWEASLGAYFVEIGLDQPAFLKRKDAPPLTEGAAVACEVIREPIGHKAARVGARTPDALAAQAKAEAEGREPPALLRPAPPPAARLARQRGAGQIRVSGAAAIAALRQALPDLTVEAAHGMPDLFAAEGIAEEFAASLAREVPFGAGGHLTIDETEALTAIDIDGGDLGPRGANEAAAPVVAREIRRRNLAGQILVDFIGDAPAIAAGKAALLRALKADPLHPELSRGDLNGIVLLTRTRFADSITRAASAPCPLSTGRWASTEHLAAALLRQAEALARHHPGRALLARAPGDVQDYLDASGLGDAAGLVLSYAQAPDRAVDVSIRP
ncbi:ribonuclease E/G [Zavarzinia sp.]|uniref:ribonuclease E/G n=1 Tax=Zavarzinia sp. TaxID=2027920 RepID=UPI003565D3FD